MYKPNYPENAMLHSTKTNAALAFELMREQWDLN